MSFYQGQEQRDMTGAFLGMIKVQRYKSIRLLLSRQQLIRLQWEYFAQIPVYRNSDNLGTLIIDMNSMAIQPENPFPEILVM